jgi:integrase
MHEVEEKCKMFDWLDEPATSSRWRSEVQELLGHSTIATTADIYSHVSSEMREEVVKKRDGFFGSS